LISRRSDQRQAQAQSPDEAAVDYPRRAFERTANAAEQAEPEAQLATHVPPNTVIAPVV
jgi:hypothetical protein